MFNFNRPNRSEKIGDKEVLNSEIKIGQDEGFLDKTRETMSRLYTAIKSKAKDAVLLATLFTAISANAQDKTFSKENQLDVDNKLEQTIKSMPLATADIVDFSKTVVSSLQDKDLVNKDLKSLRAFFKEVVNRSNPTDTFSMYSEMIIDEGNHDTLLYTFYLNKDGGIKSADATFTDGESNSIHEGNKELAKMRKNTLDALSARTTMIGVFEDLKNNQESTSNLNAESVDILTNALTVMNNEDLPQEDKLKKLKESSAQVEENRVKVEEINSLVQDLSKR